MIAARYSSYIASDLQRGWSSWNFGQDGFEGTYDELVAYLGMATEDMPISISMFEFYEGQVPSVDNFGELYPGYWVMIDKRGGLSVDILPDSIQTVEAALDFLKANPGFANGSGDGDFIHTADAVCIYSEAPEGEHGLHLIKF